MTDNIIKCESKADSYSKNAQYDFYLDEVTPVARYMKTIVGQVVGLRLNPGNKDVVDYLLRTEEKDFEHISPYNAKGRVTNDVPSYWHFRYLNEVIEVYTEYEHKYFIKKNKGLIDEGVLVPYDGREDGHIEVLYLNKMRREYEEQLATEEYEAKLAMQSSS